MTEDEFTRIAAQGVAIGLFGFAWALFESKREAIKKLIGCSVIVDNLGLIIVSIWAVVMATALVLFQP